MSDVCCLTATSASSSRRAWSSGGAGVVMLEVELCPKQRDSSKFVYGEGDLD